MKRAKGSPYRFGVFTLALLAAGCGGGSSANLSGSGANPQIAGNLRPESPLVAQSRDNRVTPGAVMYAVLHRFAGMPDGAKPNGGLIDVGGTLYGTTENGGALPKSSGIRQAWMNPCFESVSPGCGTVFSINPSGGERIVYRFTGAPSDGDSPTAGLVDVGGTLYGTTTYGGARPPGCPRLTYPHGCGTVFAVTTSGSERVVYNFGRTSNDGKNPMAPLIDVGGTLYGTTSVGGGPNKGTVFAVTPSGSEKILHSFRGNPDGASPTGGLIEIGNLLYGTTEFGGGRVGGNNYGTIYRLSLNGDEDILHRFIGFPSDGALPNGGLIYVDGEFYGVTIGGGQQNLGMFFRITPSGYYRGVFPFLNFANGNAWDPNGPLTELNGLLFGITLQSGSTRSDIGTVYSVKTVGSVTSWSVAHYFNRFSVPNGGLKNLNGTLYGTTSRGAIDSPDKNGTVYSLKPSSQKSR